MKKNGILNAQLSQVIASMGHKDKMTVCDSGFPIPIDVEKVDLAVSLGIPAFIEVLRAIATELVVEKVILAEELKNTSPKFIDAIAEIFPSVEFDYISHESFKMLSKDSRAIVRSGETKPYANVILVSGVIF